MWSEHQHYFNIFNIVDERVKLIYPGIGAQPTNLVLSLGFFILTSVEYTKSSWEKAYSSKPKNFLKPKVWYQGNIEFWTKLAITAEPKVKSSQPEVFYEQLFWKTLQSLQEKTCTGVSFSIKLKNGDLEACTDIFQFKRIYFAGHLRTAASDKRCSCATFIHS